MTAKVSTRIHNFMLHKGNRLYVITFHYDDKGCEDESETKRNTLNLPRDVSYANFCYLLLKPIDMQITF